MNNNNLGGASTSNIQGNSGSAINNNNNQNGSNLENRNRGNTIDRRFLNTLDAQRQAIVQQFSKIIRVPCQKLSKSGVFWKDRFLEVNSVSLQYFTRVRMGQPVIKACVLLDDLIDISFPGSAFSKTVSKTKQCVCFTFRTGRSKVYNKDGVEIPRKAPDPKKEQVGHTMWAFRIKESDMNFEDTKNLLAQSRIEIANQILANRNGSLSNSQMMGNDLNGDLGSTNRINNRNAGFLDLNSMQNGNDGNEDSQADPEEQNLFANSIGNNMTWDMMYNSIWDKYYEKAKSNKQVTKQDEVELAIHLFTLMGRFREVAVNSVRELVRELIFPERKRKYYEVGKEHPMYQFKTCGEKLYEVNGIFIRLSYISTTINADGFQEFNDSCSKNLCNEFKANNYLTNAIHNLILERKTNFKLRIPLTAMVEYLGFKCLCYGAPKTQMPETKKTMISKGYSKIQRAPLDASKFSMVQGLTIEERYMSLASVDDDMKFLGSRVRLKPFFIEEDKKTYEIQLSYLSEIHRFLPEEEKKFYIFRTSTVFPLHIDCDYVRPVNIYKDRLREEYLSLLDKPLSNGAFITSINAKHELEDTEVAEASQKLINEVLQRLIEDLQNLKLMAIGPESIQRIFHSYGVNMRHLGKVAEKTKLPHVKDICIAEMVARSSKKILRANIAVYIFQKFRTAENFDEEEQATLEELYGVESQIQMNASQFSSSDCPRNLTDSAKDSFRKSQMEGHGQSEMAIDDRLKNSVPSESRYPLWVTSEDMPEECKAKDPHPNNYIKRTDVQKKELVEKIFQYKIREIFWDFLNLVFANDSDTQEFWSTVLRPLVKKDFGFDLSNRFPIAISPGFLIHSIKYHWRINFNISESYELFTPKPFGNNAMRMILCANSKIYNLKNIAYHKIVQMYQDFLLESKFDLAINCLDIQETVIRASMDFEYTPPCAHELSQIIADKAEIQLKKYSTLGRKDQRLLETIEGLIRESKKFIPVFHAEIIKLSGVYHMLQLFQEGEKMNENIRSEYSNSWKILKYHLGTNHPLQSFVWCFQANQQLQSIRQGIILMKKQGREQKHDYWKNDLEICADKFKRALEISNVILGGYHLKIAEFFSDLAIVYLEMDELQAALTNMEQAKRIIEHADRNDQKAFLNAQSACEKFKKKQNGYFKECVYSQYIVCLSMCHYEDPNIETLNAVANLKRITNSRMTKISFHIEELWNFVKEFELFESTFSEDHVAFIYEFCFKAILDIEIKLLDQEYKELLFEIVLEEHSKYFEKLKAEEERLGEKRYVSKYQKFFEENKKDEMSFKQWSECVVQFAKKNHMDDSKLLKRQFYPSMRESEPGLFFSPSPYRQDKKIATLKKIAFGQVNQNESSSGAGGGGNQAGGGQYGNTQKFIQQDMKQFMQLNLLIKSIFDDIQKKMTHINRMRSNNSYDQYVNELTIRFLESESYKHFIELIECLGYDYFYYTFKNAFEYNFDPESYSSKSDFVQHQNPKGINSTDQFVKNSITVLNPVDDDPYQVPHAQQHQPPAQWGSPQLNSTMQNHVSLNNFSSHTLLPHNSNAINNNNNTTSHPSIILKSNHNVNARPASRSFVSSSALQGFRKATLSSLSLHPLFSFTLSQQQLSSVNNTRNHNQSSEVIPNENDVTHSLAVPTSNHKQSIALSRRGDQSPVKGNTNPLFKEELKNVITTLTNIPSDLYESTSPVKPRGGAGAAGAAFAPPRNNLPSRVNLTHRASISGRQLSQQLGMMAMSNSNIYRSEKQKNELMKPIEDSFLSIYQFEKACMFNSLGSIIQLILELERDNPHRQVIYRVMKSKQIPFVPKCNQCESSSSSNAQNPNSLFQSASAGTSSIVKPGLLRLKFPPQQQHATRKFSDNFTHQSPKMEFDDIAIDIIINPSNSPTTKKERVRVVFRKDNSVSFLENVHYWFRSIEEQNRSKAEVLLVKKLFIDSFQSVSHEFGTALNCISNLSELAAATMPKQVSETIMKPIKYNSTLIQFLINDILDHHMILQNTFLLDPTCFSLSDLRTELLDLFRLQVKYKALHFEIIIDSSIPDVISADRNRIQSILMTMIRNAVKHTQAGSVLVNLRLQSMNQFVHSSLFCIEVEVADTGVGLDEKESQRLEQLLNFGFSNEQISKNSLGNGVGGLSVSNLIAIRLSGISNRGIHFYSNPDSSESGTVFTFSVECCKEATANLSDQSAPTNATAMAWTKVSNSKTQLRRTQFTQSANPALPATTTTTTVITDGLLGLAQEPKQQLYLDAGGGGGGGGGMSSNRGTTQCGESPKNFPMMASVSYGLEYPSPMTPICANLVYTSITANLISRDKSQSSASKFQPIPLSTHANLLNESTNVATTPHNLLRSGQMFPNSITTATGGTIKNHCNTNPFNHINNNTNNNFTNAVAIQQSLQIPYLASSPSIMSQSHQANAAAPGGGGIPGAGATPRAQGILNMLKNTNQQLEQLQLQNENALVENLMNNLNFIREAGIVNTKESVDLDHSNNNNNNNTIINLQLISDVLSPKHQSPLLPSQSQMQQLQQSLLSSQLQQQLSKKSHFNLPKTPKNQLPLDAQSIQAGGFSSMHNGYLLSNPHLLRDTDAIKQATNSPKFSLQRRMQTAALHIQTKRKHSINLDAIIDNNIMGSPQKQSQLTLNRFASLGTAAATAASSSQTYLHATESSPSQLFHNHHHHHHLHHHHQFRLEIPQPNRASVIEQQTLEQKQQAQQQQHSNQSNQQQQPQNQGYSPQTLLQRKISSPQKQVQPPAQQNCPLKQQQQQCHLLETPYFHTNWTNSDKFFAQKSSNSFDSSENEKGDSSVPGKKQTIKESIFGINNALTNNTNTTTQQNHATSNSVLPNSISSSGSNHNTNSHSNSNNLNNNCNTNPTQINNQTRITFGAPSTSLSIIAAIAGGGGAAAPSIGEDRYQMLAGYGQQLESICRSNLALPSANPNATHISQYYSSKSFSSYHAPPTTTHTEERPKLPEFIEEGESIEMQRSSLESQEDAPIQVESPESILFQFENESNNSNNIIENAESNMKEQGEVKNGTDSSSSSSSSSSSQSSETQSVSNEETSEKKGNVLDYDYIINEQKDEVNENTDNQLENDENDKIIGGDEAKGEDSDIDVVPDERYNNTRNDHLGEQYNQQLQQAQCEYNEGQNEKLAASRRLSSSCCVKVLCVDDEPFNHFVLKAVLNSKGIACETALNGNEAVEKFASRKPCHTCGLTSYCLVFMDLNMPVKNGFEATAEIKAIASSLHWSGVTVFVCSAFVDLASKAKALACGSDHFIQKPIHQTTFFKAITDFFQI